MRASRKISVPQYSGELPENHQSVLFWPRCIFHEDNDPNWSFTNDRKNLTESLDLKLILGKLEYNIIENVEIVLNENRPLSKVLADLGGFLSQIKLW